MLCEEQNSKYKVNILWIKRKSTTWVYSVAILAPVSAQLIGTSDWDQDSGVRLVFGLTEKTQRKINPKSGITDCTSVLDSVIFVNENVEKRENIKFVNKN